MRAVGYARAPADSRASNVPLDVRERLGIILPGADVHAHRAAIAAECARREWDLGEVFVDAPDSDGSAERAGLRSAMNELSEGRAELLVATKLDAVCPWVELPGLVNRAEREGWSLVALDFGVDTLSPDGRQVLRALGQQAQALPHSGLPLPPAELMFRVVGIDSPGRFEVGGHVELLELDRLLAEHGRGVAEFGDVLDFGCGPGRFLRPLHVVAPQARLYGVDQDEEAIDWVRRALPSVEAAVAPPLPPLSLPDGRFDLIVVFSVFTHLDESYQDAWLAELRRLTRPGGMVVATVHGNSKWEVIRDGPMAGEPELEGMSAQLDRRGFLHWRGDDWRPFFPDYYHTSFHRPDYIRDRWGRWFDVIDISEPQPGKAGLDLLSSGHDVVVLRAPARTRPGLLGQLRGRLRGRPR